MALCASAYVISGASCFTGCQLLPVYVCYVSVSACLTPLPTTYWAACLRLQGLGMGDCPDGILHEPLLELGRQPYASCWCLHGMQAF